MQEEVQNNFSENPNQSTQDDTSNQDANTLQPEETLLEWTASEYIKHHKPASWYLALLGVVVVLSSVVYLVTNDIVSTVTIGLVGILFGIFASREPEVRTYKLSPKGIVISNKLYSFELFKSYAVFQEEALTSIFLLPIKRLMPGLTMYFPPDQEEQILKILADYLPFDDREPDIIDRLMNKVRF